MKNEKVLLLISACMMLLFLLVNVFVDLTMPNLFGDNIWLTIYSIFAYISSVICTIIMFYYSLSKKIDLAKHRKSIIIVSIFMFFFNIISGVLGFVVARQINTREKREIPKLEIQKNYKFYVYIILFGICMGILFGLGRIIENEIIHFSLYFVLLFLTIFIFRKDLKRDIKYFKEYFREYSTFVFKHYLIALGVIFIINLAIRLTTGLDNSTNQIEINKSLEVMPFRMIFLAVIYAPICEELLFRGCFRKLFNKKWLFILLSGFIFGIVHVIDDFQSLEELLYILSYSSLGCFLAYVYYKTNNLCCSIFFHFIQNAMSVAAILILNLLK